MFKIHQHEMSFCDKPLQLETGHIARNALASVRVKHGDTQVLCTVTATTAPVESLDFLPLSVFYQEKFSAAGKLLGGFIKREGRPSEREILASRLIDRALRPLFAEDFHHEVQVVASVLSYDPESDPIVAAIIGVSAATRLAGLPLEHTMAAVRVEHSDENKFSLYIPQVGKVSSLDLMVAGTREGVLMVEAESKEYTEEVMAEALAFGHEHIKTMIDFIDDFCEKAGISTFEYQRFQSERQEIKSALEAAVDWKSYIVAEKNAESSTRIVHPLKGEPLASKRREICHAIAGNYSHHSIALVYTLFNELLREHSRDYIFTEKKRLDGRGYQDIRPIACEVGILPQRVHGSALFTRGNTQALISVTLGGVEDAQLVDDMTGSYREPFLLHYNFPPYSVGEVGKLGAPGRRETGHGKLAWKALRGVLPEKLPYTVRLISDITESNGSSSMATVCGCSLALMDAGIAISKPVAGIAMGLVQQGKDYAVLWDISGLEDGIGDMDFKVAGTKDGITALQMDLKGEALSSQCFLDALMQAKRGRLKILATMESQSLTMPRESTSPFAPSTAVLKIQKESIGLLIGPGGRTIKELCESTQSKIDIKDDGTVNIVSQSKKNLEETTMRIQQLMERSSQTGAKMAISSRNGSDSSFSKETPEAGKCYKGKVENIKEFGAFIAFGFKKNGMVHISEVSKDRIPSINDVLTVGQEVTVKFLSEDDQGRYKLSIKQAKED